MSGAFSKSLGLKSVREYEDKILRAAREHEQRLQDLKTVQAKLQSQLQFEHAKVGCLHAFDTFASMLMVSTKKQTSRVVSVLFAGRSCSDSEAEGLD